mgnify:CR=1 FL=1
MSQTNVLTHDPSQDPTQSDDSVWIDAALRAGAEFDWITPTVSAVQYLRGVTAVMSVDTYDWPFAKMALDVAGIPSYRAEEVGSSTIFDVAIEHEYDAFYAIRNDGIPIEWKSDAHQQRALSNRGAS